VKLRPSTKIGIAITPFVLPMCAAQTASILALPVQALASPAKVVGASIVIRPVAGYFADRRVRLNFIESDDRSRSRTAGVGGEPISIRHLNRDP
jgi:hypothetical protein